jgi:hypothetical protein
MLLLIYLTIGTLVYRNSNGFSISAILKVKEENDSTVNWILMKGEWEVQRKVSKLK